MKFNNLAGLFFWLNVKLRNTGASICGWCAACKCCVWVCYKEGVGGYKRWEDLFWVCWIITKHDEIIKTITKVLHRIHSKNPLIIKIYLHIFTWSRFGDKNESDNEGIVFLRQIMAG